MPTKKLAKLISRAEKAADGLQQLTGIVTVVHNPQAAIRADIAAATDASQDTDEAKTALDGAYELLQTGIKNSNKFLVASAKVLRVYLGDKPSTLWAEAGWSERSLETPKTEDLLLPHLAKLKLFLEAHPEREVNDAQLNLTATNCAALHKALSDARSGDSANPNGIKGVNWHEGNVDSKKSTLLLTEKALETRMRNLRAEFDDVVHDPDSPHYLTMGFTRPGDTDIPGATENTRGTALGGGQVRAQCDPVTGADHYVFRIKITGVDAKFRYAGSSSNPDFIIEDLPAGSTVELQVAAANADDEQGPAGPSASVVVT
jgi:hypothetical protein